MTQPKMTAMAAGEDAGLVSEAVASASRNALASLSAAITVPEPADDTLDGMVRDLLKPMLREWFDAHLPDVVERLVQREIDSLRSAVPSIATDEFIRGA